MINNNLSFPLHQLKNTFLREIDGIIAQNKEYNDVLSHIAKVDFHARAYFEADEATAWVIRTYLILTSIDDKNITIIVDRETVWTETRYSYDQWKEQRDSDRKEAIRRLELMGRKWGCRIIPIEE